MISKRQNHKSKPNQKDTINNNHSCLTASSPAQEIGLQLDFRSRVRQRLCSPDLLADAAAEPQGAATVQNANAGTRYDGRQLDADVRPALIQDIR